MQFGGPTGPPPHLGAAIYQLFHDDDGSFSMRGWVITALGGTLLVLGGMFLLAALLGPGDPQATASVTSLTSP